MIEIFCDFDGTLTSQDTLALLLDRYAPSQWFEIEERMLSGELDEREGLKAQLALLSAPDAELLRTIEAEIRPAEGVDDLVRLARERGWPLRVLSGGLIRFSGALWRQWGYGDVPIFANDHRRDDQGRIEVIEARTPKIKGYCNHCKRWHLEEALKRGSKVVYIGDGLTDRCPAEAAHRRYARGNLLKHLKEQGLDVVPFDNLRQVAEDLRNHPL